MVSKQQDVRLSSPRDNYLLFLFLQEEYPEDLMGLRDFFYAKFYSEKILDFYKSKMKKRLEVKKGIDFDKK